MDSRQFQNIRSKSDKPQNPTTCTKMFYLFQKLTIRSLFTITSVHIHAASNVNATGDVLVHSSESFSVLRSMASDDLLGQNIPARHLDKIRNMFLENQYQYLDGLEYLVTNTEGESGNAQEDVDAFQWEASGLQLKLATNKTGSLVLEHAATSVKLKSKAEENRDTVRFLAAYF